MKRLLKDRLTENNIKKIIHLYLNGKHGTDLAKQFNICEGSIYKILKQNNVKIRSKFSFADHPIRKYDINEKYFDRIDSEEKAYMLGFIMADGTNDIPRGRVFIKLAQIDKEILCKFQKLLNVKNKLYYQSNENHQFKNAQPAFTLPIYNRKISNKLNELGVVTNKTENLIFPKYLSDLDNPLLPHFIRGYFDGDGCIYINPKTKKGKIMICSTNLFCIELQKILFYKLNLTSTITHQRKLTSTSNARTIFIYGNTQIKILVNWIYPKNHKISLKRKKEKIEKILNIINNNRHISDTPKMLALKQRNRDNCFEKYIKV